MGKKGQLIEDRVMRQPMDQFRRKLKFKQKEKRREENQLKKARLQHSDPLLGHDSNFISQLKSGKDGNEIFHNESQQEATDKMWQKVLENQERM